MLAEDVRIERGMGMKSRSDSADIPSLSPSERRLISLHLGRQMTVGDTGLLTNQLDIDRCSQAQLLILSCVGYEQGWGLFPTQIVPRLKGVHQFYQVHNTIRLPWLLGKIRALREAGIPVMLLKGLALRYYYSVGIPRIMGDYDIAVPENSYDKAIHVLQNDGDTYLGNVPWLYHGQIVGKDRCLEIHSWIFKHHGEKGTDIWDRAIPCDFYGEDVLALSPDDMLLHQMDNRSRDMFENVYPDRTPIFLCDCFRVIKAMPRLDLTGLAVRAETLHVTNSARRMLMFLADCFPDLFSKAEIERVFPETPAYRRWLDAGMKLRRASDRWHSYHYREGDSVTPLRFIRMLARHYALSRMETVEMREMGRKYNFWIYCKKRFQAGGTRALLHRVGKQPQQ